MSIIHPQPTGPLDAIDNQSFRKALGQFPTGVAIVTGRDAALSEPMGMTISSFNSVSLAPPLVLFSISRSAYSLPAWRKLPGYAINVLSHDQRRLSDGFAVALAAKWQGVSYQEGLYHAPLIKDAAAHFECESYCHYDGGDHIIFVGEVKRFRYADDISPLVFFQGKYAALVSAR